MSTQNQQENGKTAEAAPVCMFVTQCSLQNIYRQMLIQLDYNYLIKFSPEEGEKMYALVKRK